MMRERVSWRLGFARYHHFTSLALLQGAHSVGLMWWMLAREVLRMRGTISREHPWEVMPDLYFYRDPEEVSFVPRGLFVAHISTYLDTLYCQEQKLICHCI